LIDYRKYGLTAAIVLVTVIAMLLTYWDNLVNPWTRDGQVRAEVIQITPRVSGPLVDLPVADNQYVRAGDLLFEIDPRTFQATYDQKRAALDSTGDDVQALAKQVQSAEAGVAVAKAGLAQARTLVAEADATIEKNQAEYQRQQEMLPKKATSQKAVDRAKANYTVALEQRKASVAGIGEAQASLAQAEAALAEARAQLGAAGDANADIRQAQAALRQAELDLEFTKVRAPVDGYVTNLNLRTGSFAVANQPALALVDVNSYWVDGFFKETQVGEILPGDDARVTLMGYPDQPISGHVDSMGWGIAQQDGSTGFELLPNVNPSFDWIRLAQRIPVRIELGELPDGVELRVGTTASVLVKTGTADSGNGNGKGRDSRAENR
jgi:multidrug resistance efflux pump